MFSKLLLASAVLMPLGVASLSASATAEDMWNPNSSYNPKYDIKIYPKAPVNHAMAPARATKLSCAAAERIVRDDGFHRVQARDCGGRTYVFRAERHGRQVVVDVNSRNGHAWIA
jgi:hypothetical protein